MRDALAALMSGSGADTLRAGTDSHKGHSAAASGSSSSSLCMTAGEVLAQGLHSVHEAWDLADPPCVQTHDGSGAAMPPQQPRASLPHLRAHRPLALLQDASSSSSSPHAQGSGSCSKAGASNGTRIQALLTLGSGGGKGIVGHARPADDPRVAPKVPALMMDTRTGSLALKTCLSTVLDAGDSTAGASRSVASSGGGAPGLVFMEDPRVTAVHARAALITDSAVGPPSGGHAGEVASQAGGQAPAADKAVVERSLASCPGGNSAPQQVPHWLSGVFARASVRKSASQTVVFARKSLMVGGAGSKRSDSIDRGTVPGSDGGNSALGSALTHPPTAATAAESARLKYRRLPPPDKALLDEVETILAGSEKAWQFDAFALAHASSGHPLSVLGYYLIHRTGLIKTFDINAAKLAK